MTLWTIFLLLSAGFLGGIANAMAGGASLFTFPALVESGLSPIVANASNSFALLPANSLGAYGDREKLPVRDGAFWLGTVMTVLGGIIGGAFLLVTPARLFAVLVPALIGLATIIFIFSTSIRRFFNTLIAGDNHPRLRAAMIFLAAIYCGYFGAGVGVIFMAVIGATTPWDLRSSNAYKNILGFLGNLGAVAIFIWQGVISWPFAFVMMIGTSAGGLAGVQLVKVLPAPVIRAVIATAGVIMTAIYIYRFWL